MQVRVIEPHGVLEQRNTDCCHANGRTTMPAAILVANVEEKIAKRQHSEVVLFGHAFGCSDAIDLLIQIGAFEAFPAQGRRLDVFDVLNLLCTHGFEFEILDAITQQDLWRDMYILAFLMFPPRFQRTFGSSSVVRGISDTVGIHFRKLSITGFQAHRWIRIPRSLKRDPDGFLRRSVQDLFSLAQRTIVITGGARGIGLAFAFAVAEAGGNVAILDVSEDPHPHFFELVKRFPDQQLKIYRCVHHIENRTFACANELIQDRCNKIRRFAGFD